MLELIFLFVIVLTAQIMMKIRLAAILPNSNVNGEGLRKVFFSQGCRHHCQGCFNQHTWPFNGGKVCDCDQLVNETLEETYLSGVTFCGGEPFQQPIPFAYLAKKFKKNEINIWCFTGYTWEELQDLMKSDGNVKNLLTNLDVLIDGRFDKTKMNTKDKFPSTTNQRVIDVQKSLKIGKVVLWKKQFVLI